MKKLLLLIPGLMVFAGSYAQMQIDKPLQLTGTGSDAKIEGVEEVANDHDAANKIYVDTAIANRAGNASNLDYSLTTDKNSVLTNPGHDTQHDPIGITATLNSGFAAVSLVVNGLPSGVTYSVTPGGGFPTFNSTLIFYVDNSVAPGSYPAVLEGNGGITQQSVNLTLYVQEVKRIFVTAADLGSDVSVAQRDNLCATEASNASLSGTYKAWISNGASNNISPTSGVSYRKVNNDLVAWDWADLTDGAIANAINLSASGAAVSGTVWTGLNNDGTVASDNCSNWSTFSHTVEGAAGNTANTTGWSNAGNAACGNPPSEAGEASQSSRCTNCGYTPVMQSCSGCGIYDLQPNCTFSSTITWGMSTYYDCMTASSTADKKLYCVQQ